MKVGEKRKMVEQYGYYRSKIRHFGVRTLGGELLGRIMQCKNCLNTSFKIIWINSLCRAECIKCGEAVWDFDERLQHKPRMNKLLSYGQGG
jgi:hypothetical protein